jgi:hypothetical protein
VTDQERLSQTALILFREAEALRLKGKTDAANQILSIATQIAKRAEELRGN